MIFFWFSIEDWPRIFYRSIDLSSIECNNTLFVAICGRKGSQNCTRKIFVRLIQLYKRVIQILPGLKIVLSRQVIYIRHTSYVYYPVIKICANNWKNISIQTLFITIKNFYSTLRCIVFISSRDNTQFDIQIIQLGVIS